MVPRRGMKSLIIQPHSDRLVLLFHLFSSSCCIIAGHGSAGQKVEWKVEGIRASSVDFDAIQNYSGIRHCLTSLGPFKGALLSLDINHDGKQAKQTGE